MGFQGTAHFFLRGVAWGIGPRGRKINVAADNVEFSPGLQIAALIRHLADQINEHEKCLIFSQFSDMVKLICDALTANKIR